MNTTKPTWIDSAITMLNKLTSGSVELEFCNSDLSEESPTEDYAFFTIASTTRITLPEITLMGGSALYSHNTISTLASFLKENKLDIEIAVINGMLRVILTRDCEIYNSYWFETLLEKRATTTNNVVANFDC